MCFCRSGKVSLSVCLSLPLFLSLSRLFYRCEAGSCVGRAWRCHIKMDPETRSRQQIVLILLGALTLASCYPQHRCEYEDYLLGKNYKLF